MISYRPRLPELECLPLQIAAWGRELTPPEHAIVGESISVRHLTRLIQKVATSDSTVLVHGESGTGKELVAIAIHRNSARCKKPFVAINCAAIPETLLESELFVYERGGLHRRECQQKRQAGSSRRRRRFSGRNWGAGLYLAGQAVSRTAGGEDGTSNDWVTGTLTIMDNSGDQTPYHINLCHKSYYE